MMIIYQLSITNMAFLRKYRRFYLISFKKKVKHDLKILFSLFKKVSLVDDDNFLALFLCAFFIFLGHFISLPYIHFMFYGCVS